VIGRVCIACNSAFDSLFVTQLQRLSRGRMLDDADSDVEAVHILSLTPLLPTVFGQSVVEQ
jgi:hypothetical protein